METRTEVADALRNLDCVIYECLAGDAYREAKSALDVLARAALFSAHPPAPRLSLDALDECLRELEERCNAAWAGSLETESSVTWAMLLAQRAAYRHALSLVQAARDSLAAQLQEYPS